MARLVTVLYFLSVSLSRTKVLSFNIEHRNPIVKRAEAAERGSYFGFSVAQHAVEEGSDNPENYWILVGAPLGQNLQQGTNHSGALFKCPVTRDREDCIQIETDGKRLAGGRYKFDNFDYEDTPTLREPQSLLRPGNDEIKDGQWLGVTVRSQKPGGKVVVCAHRYIQSPNLTQHHYGMGLCYLLSNQLNTEDDLQPCKGRPTEKLHQQFGYCQVGTSLAVLEDGYALMGSPGPYTWRGTVFAKSIVGDFLHKDKTVYKGPLNDNPAPIDKYSYLGMSVTGGHFFQKNDIIFVSGAPRSHLAGQVYFFKKTKSVEELNITLVITGEQFASSYGYEVLATDINRDGYDDLLVGAPFFYGNDVGGAVYIYNNLRDCTQDNCNYSSVLKGKPESRFGFSMTSLGDINKDGYTDIAIGAPYENDEGAIYIYLGSRDGLSQEPSQIIRHEGVKTVGYSLSGGLDMDLNEYPDLLAGAYESDLVVLYKTRPIIDIQISIRGDELRNINATKKGCATDPNSNKTCFSFSSCFTMSKFRSGGAPFEVRYEIKELPKKVSRVHFNHTGNVKFIDGADIRGEYCQTETVYLNEANGDILTPINFEVNYTLHNNEVDSPILNKTSVKMFNATFQKSCGDDDVCRSNLYLTAGTLLEESEDGYILNLADKKEFLLDANVTNFGESAYEAKLFVVHPETLSYVALQLDKNKTNICSYHNDTMVICKLGNPFPGNQTIELRMRFEIKDTTQQKLDLKVFVNSTSYETSKQTSQSFVAILQKLVQFSIKGKAITPPVFFSGKVIGQSGMKYLEDIGPKVYHHYDVMNQGSWQVRNVEVVIQWPYQIYSDRVEGGKWLLYLERSPLIDQPSINYCTVDDPKIVNPLHLNSSGLDEGVPENFTQPYGDVAGKVRRKRDVDDIVAARTVTGTDGKPRTVVTMDCGGGDRKATAKCATITCRIPLLDRDSQVKIQIFSRIWNSTLLEDYSNVDWVSIKSVGFLRPDNTAVKISNESVLFTAVETIAYPEVVQTDTSLNIWIIIGSVIAGLILLIILIFILYKVGFFKRNRIKDHTLSGNLKKQGESENLLKDNEGRAAKSAL